MKITKGKCVRTSGRERGIGEPVAGPAERLARRCWRLAGQPVSAV